MPELGHMAYYVRNLERSVAFYEKVVGLTVVGRIFKGRAAVLSGGRSHHELLLIQVSTADGPLIGRRIGLYHAGWKVGDSLTDLKEALDRAQLYGCNVDTATDHKMMFSLYLRDPDENEVELFVDNPDYDWSQDTSWMEAPVRPLDLSLSCLNRIEKDRAKGTKTTERQPSAPPKSVPSLVQETSLPVTPLRPSLQQQPQSTYNAESQPSQTQVQAQAHIKAQQLLFQAQAQAAESKPDKLSGITNPVIASRPPLELRLKNIHELETEQKHEQTIRYTQNHNLVAQPQHDTTQDEMAPGQSRANRQFDGDVSITQVRPDVGSPDTRANSSGEQESATPNNYGNTESQDLTWRGAPGESQYALEHAAA